MTHILSFSPASIELLWMRGNNKIFEFISGKKVSWLVFIKILYNFLKPNLTPCFYVKIKKNVENKGF